MPTNVYPLNPTLFYLIKFGTWTGTVYRHWTRHVDANPSFPPFPTKLVCTMNEILSLIWWKMNCQQNSLYANTKLRVHWKCSSFWFGVKEETNITRIAVQISVNYVDVIIIMHDVLLKNQLVKCGVKNFILNIYVRVRLGVLLGKGSCLR